MWNRAFACALLIGASTALAAAATEAPVAAQDIDVDALARAKDVDAKAAPAPATTAAPAEAVAEPASASKSTAATPVAEVANPVATNADAVAPVERAEAATAAATDGQSTEPQTDATAADTAASGKADNEASPAADAKAEQQRLAASCIARATSLLDAAQKGDYAAATKDFDARMAAALSPAQFGAAWNQLSQFGKLTARGQSHPIKGDGYLAVTIPLIFEKKNLYAQVACGSDGRVAGFYVKPLDIPVQ